MQNKPRISIVVPTYKRPDALAGVVKTVSAQTFVDWELIIVDDNPPESREREQGRAIMAGFIGARIHYIEQAKNSGACAARNAGATMAQAELIAFLDDDDHWHQDKLQQQYDTFVKNPQLALNICNIVETYNGRTERFDYDVPEGEFYRYFLNRAQGVCCSAIMVRKHYFEAVNGFDEQLQSYQDLDLMLRLAGQFSASVTRDYLLFYKLADDGITKNPGKKIAGLERIIEKFSSDLTMPDYMPARHHLYSALGDFFVLGNQCTNAKRAYKKALSAAFSPKLWIKLWLSRLHMRGLFIWLLNQNHRRSANRQADAV